MSDPLQSSVVIGPAISSGFKTEIPATPPIPHFTSSPDAVYFHKIFDQEIDVFVNASRGKISDYMLLFAGGCLGSIVQTVTYLYDYCAQGAGVMPLQGLVQVVAFFVFLALTIAFGLITKDNTKTAKDLAKVFADSPLLSCKKYRTERARRQVYYYPKED